MRARRARIGAALAVALVPLGCGGSSAEIEFDPGSSATTTSTAPPDSTSGTQTPTGDDANRAAPDPEVASSPAGTLPPIGEPVDGPLVSLHGEAQYLHGANLPWVDFGCDFGCGDGRGASTSATRTIVDSALGSAEFAGMNVVRWWMFPGRPVQFETDAAGLPTGIDPSVHVDIEAALDLAAQHDVAYIFTLFASPTDLPDEWLASEAGRRAVATVLGELAGRYAGRAEISTWQVFNEPEWTIWNGEVQVADVQSLVELVAAAIHANSDTLVSVGGGRLDGITLWRDLGLDYLTVHWYDPMRASEWCVPCTTQPALAAALGLDEPIVVGELYAGSEIDPLHRLQELRDRGYAGTLAWSLLPDRTADGMQIDFEAATLFGAELQADAGL